MAKKGVFPKLLKAELPSGLEHIWDSSIERRGEANFIAGMAHNPELLDWYLKDFYEKVFYSGSVARRYKELGRLRLSTVHGCRSCNQGNRLDALDGGLTETEVDHIHNKRFPGYSSADKAVLNLADLMSMAAEPGSILEHDVYSVLSAHFSNSEILEMAMTFATLSGIARFVFAFDLADKEDYCEF